MKKNLYRYIPPLSIIILFLVMFSGFLLGQRVLLGTDPVISNANLSAADVWVLAQSGWKETPLLGMPASFGITLIRALKAGFQNGVLWNNWYHGLACLFSSFLLLRYLRRSGVSAAAATLASIAAFWLSVNLTIIYAGHPAKPYIIMLFVAALIPVSKAVSGSLAHGLLWGGCVGMMFTYQPDVALFFALFAGTYFLFRLGREIGFKSPVRWVRILAPALILAFVFASGPLLGAYKSRVKNTVQTQVQTPQQKWDYMTQWSFPPDESIAFVAPGYTGWRSGEPDGPYWGRMGQSAGWEKTRQGFQNFKMENMYIGLIPIAFALFGLFSCRRSKHRAEILFWGAATVVALLLSFGKFFPLYGLFYKLPLVNNIRNPNKFLQVFQVCLAILTAYGIDALFIRPAKDEDDPQKTVERKHGVRPFFWVMVGVLGLFGIGALSLTLGRADDIRLFAGQGWSQEAAKTIVQNRISALWHASFMALMVTAVFAFFSFPQFKKVLRFRNWIAAAMVALVAVDAVKLSRHYINEMPSSFIAGNPLTGFLKDHLEHERVALTQQDQVFGVLQTYTLPYNRIAVFNPGDMSRMPVDYKKFLQSAQRDPLALWEFSAVKYVLGPSAIESQVPAARAQKIFACSVLPRGNGGFSLQPNQAGPIAVYELHESLPRYALFAGSRKMSEEEALQRIGDLSQLSLLPDSTFPELSGRGLCGSIRVEKHRPDRVVLSVDSKTDAILRCADRYAAGWKAKLDGRSVELEPVDYICRGVYVPAGEHRVEIYYNATKGSFYVQMTGYLIFTLALAWSFRKNKQNGELQDVSSL